VILFSHLQALSLPAPAGAAGGMGAESSASFAKSQAVEMVEEQTELTYQYLII
jgi:hypothetical protein